MLILGSWEKWLDIVLKHFDFWNILKTIFLGDLFLTHRLKTVIHVIISKHIIVP